MNSNTTTTCKHCKLRPAFPGYEYCGKTCGKAAKSQASGASNTPASFMSQFSTALWGSGTANPKSTSSGDDDGYGASSSRAGGSAGLGSFLAPPSARMCIICKFRPAHAQHDFCSKTCARAAPKSSGPHPTQSTLAQKRRGFLYAQDTGTGYGYDDGDGGNGDGYGDDEDEDETIRPRRRALSDFALVRRGPQLCLNCHIFPKMTPFDFCSKSCKAQAQAKLSGPFSQTQPLSYQSTGTGFIVPNTTGGFGTPSTSSGFVLPSASPYSYGAPPPYTSAPGPASSSIFDDPFSYTPSAVVGPPCSIPGCTGLGPTPKAKYCSVACGKAAVTQGLAVPCLLCNELPKIGQFHWCGPICQRKAERGAPMLLELPSLDPKFADIVNQFTVTWSPLKGPVPTIHKIYKCMNTKATEDSFQQYRLKVEAAGKFVDKGKSAGNENRRWHGTARKCTIGDSSIKLTPCSSPACFVCCIIKTGFNIKYAAQGWYGTGLYCSSHSSTSNGYTKGPTPGSPYRAMFLNRVIVGDEYVWGKTKGKDAAARALVAPPDGCDSVASDTKHNEIIVYRNDAMVASWLILYA